METLASSPALSQADTTTIDSLPSTHTHTPSDPAEEPSLEKLAPPREQYLQKLTFGGGTPMKLAGPCPSCNYEAPISKLHLQT